MPDNPLKPIELMSVGRRQSYSGSTFEFTEADLQAIAQNFSSAPFVPGHPKDDAPQFGKATRVEYRDGKLLATEYDEVDPTFKAIVNSGELPGVSVKLRLPGHPQNPGSTYQIAHIGFLGKSRPADAGIGEAAFSATELEAEFAAASQDSHQKETVGVDASGGDIAAPSAKTPDNDPPTQEIEPMTTPTPAPAPTQPDRTAEFAQREADLAARAADLEAKTAAFARRQAVSPWIEQQVIAGRVLPAEKAPLVEVFAALPEELEIQFSQGDDEVKQPIAAFLKSFIKGMPQRVNYGEVASAEFAQGDDKKEPEETATEKSRKILQKQYDERARRR